MKKLILSSLILVSSLISVNSAFAGSGTDAYCNNDSENTFGINANYHGIFNVQGETGEIKITNVLKVNSGIGGIVEPKMVLYYVVPEEKNKQYAIYQYNCSTKKPTRLSSIKDPRSDIAVGIHDIRISTYNKQYIVLGFVGDTDGGLHDTYISIYDIRNKKIVVTFENKGGIAQFISKNKRGNFMIGLSTNHPVISRETSLIEINPKTKKIIEL